MEDKLIPRGSRVLVETDEFKYTGRLVIPDSAKRRPTTGVIAAMGPDCGEECDLKVGDRVLYGQFSGTLVQFKGQPAYTILDQSEILAKVAGEDILDYMAAG